MDKTINDDGFVRVDFIEHGLNGWAVADATLGDVPQISLMSADFIEHGLNGLNG